MTIHQPSARIFNLFDKVILLSQGHLVYFGAARDAVGYFSKIGYQCPIHENPADYFVDLMSLDFRGDDVLVESRKRVAGLVYSFIDYRAKSSSTERLRFKYLCDQDIATADYEAALGQYTHRNRWAYEYAVLARRDWVNLMRNSSFLISQAIQSLVTALLVGFMFFYLKHDSVSVQNRLGVLYIIAINATFPTIMPALYAFFGEREIMLRERSAAVYRVTTFYVAKATTFMPIALISSTIFITGVYFISHLTFDVAKFFVTLGVLSCLNIVSISFMLMTGSAVRNMDIAFVIAPAVVTVELLFGGLLANPTSIAPAISDGSVGSNKPSLHASDKKEDLGLESEVVLSWRNIEYKVTTKANKQTSVKTILNSVSGHINAGEIVALIGSSGAGKTTLLNALSGRIVGGQLTGDIRFQGSRRNPASFKRLTAYVQQDDLMHPLLSVEETLTYAAKLRLQNAIYSPSQKVERVNEVIRQLRLEAARNTRIGNAATRGVSGGERKRVSIGSELLTDPKLLFLDEPTSGLDSNSSEMVVELVKKISVEQNTAAIMTIHQPNARIFNLFDRVILLSQGSVVYFGPTSGSINYFASIGYQCPMHENPADYFVDLMTLDYRSEGLLVESRKRVNNLVERFAVYSGQLDMRADGKPNKHQVESVESSYATIANDVGSKKNSWISEYITLFRRDWTNIYRDIYYSVCQILQPIAMCLMIGFMFYNLKHDELSIQNRLGVLYIIIVQATFPIFMPQIALFVDDLVIAVRERSSASYRFSTYYASKVSTYVPIALLCNTLFYVGVYFISRLDFDARKFFIGMAVFYCQNVVTVGLMFIFGAWIKSIAVIYVLSTAVLTSQLLFSGLFANFQTVTDVLSWVRWINPIYYSFSALAQNEMSDMTFACSAGPQCSQTGKEVLSSYSLDGFNIWQDVLMLLLIGAVFYICGFLLLIWKGTPKYLWV
ncbi:hypothetical protein GGI15_002228 [Coemansia interrupta]|uniref:ABC transporter domain-containing protein n=1 Tax=Coemansia interrupta TaxID=1126814 RepID=A0A9W8LLW8_9FUNG|nr:hypothetical protein GGI15_002228 [Coemansia interrupta]